MHYYIIESTLLKSAVCIALCNKTSKKITIYYRQVLLFYFEKHQTVANTLNILTCKFEKYIRNMFPNEFRVGYIKYRQENKSVL